MYIYLEIFLQEGIMDDKAKTILFVIAILIFIIFLATLKKIPDVHDNKTYMLDMQFPVQEYYSTLKKLIEAENMPHVKFNLIKYNEFHAFSALRDYFRVSYRDDIFDICAAPFGNGSFVSYWLGEPRKRLKKWALKVAAAYSGKVVDDFERTTRYEIDTRAVFKARVIRCIERSIDEIIENKGMRVSPEELTKAQA